MSNINPKNSRKRKYNPDSSNICESKSVKLCAQPTETWSSFLSNLSVDVQSPNVDKSTKLISTKNKLLKTKDDLLNVSQSVIQEISPKFPGKLIKRENYENISCDIKCENEIKLEKQMKTELNSNIFSKSDCYSYENNENLCLNEDDINEENSNFLSHITSTPVKKPQIKQLENSSFSLSVPSDLSSSVICTSLRNIRQKSILDTKKTLKPFRGELTMRNHMKTVHLHDEFPWKCSDCGEKFSVLLDFVSHKKVAHNKDVKNWTCYICGEMDELVYQCHYCKYRNASLSLYQVHLNGHKVDRSLLQCHHCDKRFDRRNAMMDHMKSFHRDEKLECQICGLKSTNLPQHVASVHAGAPKACSICGQQFRYKRDLQLHEMKIHDAQPLAKCDICGASLPDYYYRKKHMRAHDEHVDENGQYLPLPESEIKKLDGIIKRRMNHPSRFVSKMCGPDEPSFCSHLITDVARQQANVASNSKMIDTSDLKFFLINSDK